MRRDDVRVLRRAPLQALEQRRVDAQLEDCAGARLRRELRVRDLVRPGAERALVRDLAEEIRAAVPPLVAERRLIDDVGAVAHRGERRLEVVGAGRRANLDDAELLRAQVLQIARLVLAAALHQEIDDRIVAMGPALAPLGHGELEPAQVAAAQVVREVRGGQPQ
jgi:hypothetical protein